MVCDFQSGFRSETQRLKTHPVFDGGWQVLGEIYWEKSRLKILWRNSVNFTLAASVADSHILVQIWGAVPVATAL